MTQFQKSPARSSMISIVTKSLRPKIALSLVSASILLCANAQAQQVALLDSGVDPSRGFNVVPGFNYFLNVEETDDVSDREGEGHGTVSVRVLSEAFSGEIVPFVVTDGSLDGSQASSVRAARDSALSDILGRDDVRVIAITWGTEGVVSSAAPLLPDLSRANKVIAIMAGNELSSQPNSLATSSFNLQGAIIVGGTDGEGVLLPESNRAGTTANKYVAAIGLPDENSTRGGSSWATARIAGIAGAVLQQNSELTAAEVVEVILESAEDRGETGTDNVYGRGVILSADQVLNNVIGPPVIPVTPEPPADTGGGGGGGGGAGAALLVGGAVAGALLLGRKSKTKLEKTLILDSYGRAFQIDLNDHVAVNDGSLHLNDFFHALQQTSIGDGFLLPELNTEVAFGAVTDADHRFDMIEYFGMPGDVVLENNEAQVSLALRSKLSSSIDLTAGYRVSPSQSFGAVSKLDSHELFGAASFISGQAFDSVLSGFSSQAQTASLAYTPKNLSKANLKLGLVSVDQSQRFGQDTFSTILEGAYQFASNTDVSLQFGQIQENGSLFGGAAGGVFGVESATTYAINMAARVKATDKVSMVANYGIGRTNVDASEQSLLKDFSSLSSDWYSLGMVASNMFRAKDQLGIAFSQPLKIRSGGVDYSIPTGRESNGNIAFNRERINLSETGATERSLEGYYRTMLTDRLELGSFLAYRQNPNHIADNGDEVIVMATLRFSQ